MTLHALTPRRARFVQEYLVDLSGTQAAIRAGYAAASASVEGARLLADAKIAAAIADAKNARAARTQVTADHVLRELARIAFADMGQFSTWDGAQARLIPSKMLDRDATAAVAEVSQGEHGVRIKLHDKGAALDKLIRHLGLFDDKLKLQGEPFQLTIVKSVKPKDEGAG